MCFYELDVVACSLNAFPVFVFMTPVIDPQAGFEVVPPELHPRFIPGNVFPSPPWRCIHNFVLVTHCQGPRTCHSPRAIARRYESTIIRHAIQINPIHRVYAIRLRHHRPVPAYHVPAGISATTCLLRWFIAFESLCRIKWWWFHCRCEQLVYRTILVHSWSAIRIIRIGSALNLLN